MLWWEGEITRYSPSPGCSSIICLSLGEKKALKLAWE